MIHVFYIKIAQSFLRNFFKYSKGIIGVMKFEKFPIFLLFFLILLLSFTIYKLNNGYLIYKNSKKFHKKQVGQY